MLGLLDIIEDLFLADIPFGEFFEFGLLELLDLFELFLFFFLA